MNRPVNFSAGPSMIPLEVLETLGKEMVDFEGSGLSLVEVSHQGCGLFCRPRSCDFSDKGTDVRS